MRYIKTSDDVEKPFKPGISISINISLYVLQHVDDTFY